MARATGALVDQQLHDYMFGDFDALNAAKSKLFATQWHCEAIDHCRQLFGGYGYVWEFPSARAGKIARGSVEVMKEIISRDLFR
ncbi:MAG: acyl-CoA dehydrogenase [Gammaproteobacteria bacterium]|jgi:acyl-CoA dehydrogenase